MLQHASSKVIECWPRVAAEDQAWWTDYHAKGSKKRSIGDVENTEEDYTVDMQIIVTVPVKSSATIGHVKAKIQDYLRIPYGNQELKDGSNSVCDAMMPISNLPKKKLWLDIVRGPGVKLTPASSSVPGTPPAPWKF